MKNNIAQNIFVEGPISPGHIAEIISNHKDSLQIGAHDIFIGQVRADEIAGKVVRGIEYTAYEEMALNKFNKIIADAIEKYALFSAHIYHSLGLVKTGEICLFVLVTAGHRKEVFRAQKYIVEAIKNEAPIFGKELFTDASYQWKTNT